MKKTAGLLLIVVMGCNEPQQKAPATTLAPMATKDTTMEQLAKLTFDSKKDLSCGMPISAGLSDTAQYKGKLYGFCSAECKADFLKDPEAHLKAGK